MSWHAMRKLAVLCRSLCVASVLALICVVPAIAHAHGSGRQDDAARYTVTFNSTWSAETHPGFPSSAHFSPLIGATHNMSVTLWTSGVLASPGMEEMAETGGVTTLRNEIEALGPAVRETISGPGMGGSPGAVTIPTIVAGREHPMVTLVTMIAPSPDWFVGVHHLSLQDDQGQWRNRVSVLLYAYDAGTDDGTDYTSPDQEPAQHQPIRSLRGLAPFSDAPIGEFVFTRQHLSYLPLVVR